MSTQTHHPFSIFSTLPLASTVTTSCHHHRPLRLCRRPPSSPATSHHPHLSPAITVAGHQPQQLTVSDHRVDACHQPPPSPVADHHPRHWSPTTTVTCCRPLRCCQSPATATAANNFRTYTKH